MLTAPFPTPAAMVMWFLVLFLIRRSGKGMRNHFAIVMVVVLFSFDVMSGPQEQNQSERQTGREDRQDVLEQKARGPGDRLGGVERVQTLQLGEQHEVHRHGVKSFRTGTTVSSSGPASRLMF